MATTTQVAEALDALVAAAQAGLEQEDVVVIDGQPRRGELANSPDALILGFSGSGASVEIVQEDADLGGGRNEYLSINCLASSFRGENDEVAPAEVRRRVVELLDLLADLLEQDPTLGGMVTEARFGMASELVQSQVEGTEANIEFTVLAETL